MKEIGAKIREIREEKKLTLRELGFKTELDHSYIGKIERGKVSSPSLETLKRISEALDVEVSSFFGDGEKGIVPEELKEIGVEWVSFAKEMKQRELTPEQIKAFLKFIDDMGIGKK